jgi:hypothetical protein
MKELKFKKMSVFNDKDNKKSAKRVAGFVVLGVAMLIALGVTAAYIISSLDKDIQPIQLGGLNGMFSMLIGAGTTLLGLGLGEKPKAKG